VTTSDTPETDAITSVGLENADRECVPAEFARQLEHSRDEWAAMCGRYKQERDEVKEKYRWAVIHWQIGSAKMERERDEARESLKHIAEYGTEEINAAVDLRQKLAQALVDLDNMQDQRDLAMKVIKRLEQERDGAREELENEMKWHHQTHKELVEAQCKLLDIEYDKLKS
jgi:hypothetical protein